jgi:hypothetical protein
VKVDITIYEALFFPLANRPVLRGYAEFADIPENRSILVYALDEIAAEKTVAGSARTSASRYNASQPVIAAAPLEARQFDSLLGTWPPM